MICTEDRELLLAQGFLGTERGFKHSVLLMGLWEALTKSYGNSDDPAIASRREHPQSPASKVKKNDQGKGMLSTGTT